LKYLFVIVLAVLLSDYNTQENSYIIDFFLLSVMGIIAIINSTKIKEIISKKRDLFFYSFLLFFVLLNVSYIRTNLLGNNVFYSISKILVFTFFILATISFLINMEKANNRVNFKSSNNIFFFYVMTLPMVYVLLNFFLKIYSFDIFNFIKLSPEVGRSDTLYSLTGLEFDRVSFPLSNGVNNFGSFLGGACLISLSFFFTTDNKKFKIYALLFVIICIPGLMLLDTRSALIAVILICLSTVLLKDSKHLKISGNLIWIVGLLPVILVLTNFLVDNSDSLSFLARENEEAGTGNGRNIIWAFSISELLNFKFIHLFGFGEFGQAGSRVSDLWAEDLSIYANSQYTSTHNTTLQLIFDIGYIGAVIYYTVLISASKCIYKMYNITGNSNLIIFQNFLLYLAFVGGTESTNAHKSTFFLLIYILICLQYYKTRLLSLKMM
jgi:O-antigen ligase